MKPSIFTNIFRDFPLEEVIPEVARIGYQGIELMARAPHVPPSTQAARVRDIKRMVDDHGLVVSNIAGYAGRFSQLNDEQAAVQLDDLGRLLEIANALHCPLVRHQPGGPSYDVASEEQWQRAVLWTQRAAVLAARAGVRLVVELHPDGLVETADSAFDFLQRVAKDNVGAIFDPGNMYLAGTPFGAGEVYKLWGHIFHVHVKDCLRVQDPTYPSSRQWRGGLIAFKVLGEGAADHLPALRALHRLGYQGYLSCECEMRWPDKEAVLHCAAHEFRVLTQLIELAVS
jgi:sugar phosphate isomerase/epimerase